MPTFTIWNGVIPGGTSAVNAGVRTDGVQFTVSSPCTLTAVGYYLPAGSTLTGASYTANVWSTTNASTGTLLEGPDSGSGTWTAGAWNFITLTSPVSLVPGTTYVAAISSVDNLQFEHNYWGAGNPGAGGVTSGPITVPDASAAIGGIQQPFVTSANTFPSFVSSQSWYGVDIQVDTSGGPTFSGTGTAALSLAASASGQAQRAGSGQGALSLAAGSSGQAQRHGTGVAALALLAVASGSSQRSGTGTAAMALAARSTGFIPGTVGERQLVRLAVARYFGGAQVTADAGVCFQGGPLTGFGLGTAYPYTVRHVPDEYYTAGMPAGQDWGCVMSTTRLERNTKLDSYGGKYSGYWARGYVITCQVALICELPHIEVAGAGLDDLIDALENLIFADRTLGTNDGSQGVRILQAGPGRAGIRDVTDKFEALDEVKGRYAAEATVTFEALTMIAA